MTILSSLGLVDKSHQLEQQYGLPSGLLEAQAQQEGGYNPSTGVNNYSSTGAYGLAQVLPSTAASPGYGVTPITMQQAGDPSQALTFMAQYDAGRIKAAGGNVDAGISGYSGGAYSATSLGVNPNGSSPTGTGSSTMGTDTTSGGDTVSVGAPNTNAVGGASDASTYTYTPNTFLPGGTLTAANDTSSYSLAPSLSGVATGGNAGPLGAITSAIPGLGGGSSSTSALGAIIAQIEAWLGDVFVRGAVITLGIIFVGVGLMYFGSGGSVTPGGVGRVIKKGVKIAAV